MFKTLTQQDRDLYRKCIAFIAALKEADNTPRDEALLLQLKAWQKEHWKRKCQACHGKKVLGDTLYGEESTIPCGFCDEDGLQDHEEIGNWLRVCGEILRRSEKKKFHRKEKVDVVKS